MNEDALDAERRGEFADSLFSLYNIGGREIYIITKCDRSATTILFPEGRSRRSRWRSCIWRRSQVCACCSAR